MTTALKQKKTLPTTRKLSPSLKLGVIELNVNNMEEMKNFYHSVMGLDIIKEDVDHVIVGKNNQALITLHHQERLHPADSSHAGLYHFAIVFASRGDLARMVYSILKHRPQHFSGSADHLVSEAFYFTDPEGNGIELYYDRDRSQWQWENNQVKMATLYIDPAEYLQRYLILEEPNKEVQMGHFHLKVGDIEKARQFYVNILGFDVTAELPGALFISVNGYHHHLGLNTWESLGAGERKQSLGLERLEFILPDKKDVDALKSRLLENAVRFREEDNELELSDPWGNKIVVKISGM
jgi:catechol 2,3-dioxygenase